MTDTFSTGQSYRTKQVLIVAKAGSGKADMHRVEGNEILKFERVDNNYPDRPYAFLTSNSTPVWLNEAQCHNLELVLYMLPEELEKDVSYKTLCAMRVTVILLTVGILSLAKDKIIKFVGVDNDFTLCPYKFLYEGKQIWLSAKQVEGLTKA